MLWEHVDFEDWENIVARVSELIVLHWDSRTEQERHNLMADVSNKMQWILERYPEPPALDRLEAMRPWFREQAIVLIMGHMRQSLIYRGAPDATLLENISEGLVAQMADHLMVVASAFFRVVSTFDPALSSMAANLEDWDADADLRRLLAEEQDKE